MTSVRRRWKCIAACMPLAAMLGMGLWGWPAMTAGSSVMKAKFDRLSIGMTEKESLAVLQDGRPAQMTIWGADPVDIVYCDVSHFMHGGQIMIRCANGRLTRMDLRPPTILQTFAHWYGQAMSKMGF